MCCKTNKKSTISKGKQDRWSQMIELEGLQYIKSHQHTDPLFNNIILFVYLPKKLLIKRWIVMTLIMKADTVFSQLHKLFLTTK